MERRQREDEVTMSKIENSNAQQQVHIAHQEQIIDKLALDLVEKERESQVPIYIYIYIYV